MSNSSDECLAPETEILPTPNVFEQAVAGLETHGFAVLKAALPDTLTVALLADLARMPSAEFLPAGVGRGTDWQHAERLRRDKIAWIEGESEASRLWLEWADGLKTYLNRRLFLGLFSFESHYALYRPGDYYRKHLDAFRGRGNRVLSLVTYLNDGWRPEWGGQLLIYNEAGAEVLQSVSPQLGTVVIFLSEVFPHEVLPAVRPRHSIAGWFRVNSFEKGVLDPP